MRRNPGEAQRPTKTGVRGQSPRFHSAFGPRPRVRRSELGKYQTKTGTSAAFRQPGDSALGVGGGGSAPTPPKCRPKGLRNVGLWASPRLRLRIAVGKYY